MIHSCSLHRAVYLALSSKLASVFLNLARSPPLSEAIYAKSFLKSWGSTFCNYSGLHSKSFPSIQWWSYQNPNQVLWILSLLACPWLTSLRVPWISHNHSFPLEVCSPIHNCFGNFFSGSSRCHQSLIRTMTFVWPWHYHPIQSQSSSSCLGAS